MTTDWLALHSALTNAEADYNNLHAALSQEQSSHAADVVSLNHQIEGQASNIAGLRADLVALQAKYDAYVHDHPGTTPPPPPPPPPPVSTGLIGMSAGATDWAARMKEVCPTPTSPKPEARRIFADLAAGGNSQMNLVRDAQAANMLPVVSYKVGSDITRALSGSYDAAASQAAAALRALNIPVAVTIWHEPNPDITGVQYRKLHARLMPIFKTGKIVVGPILNGWLLDNQVDEFDSYTDPSLFAMWDFFGIDTYEQGTMASPGKNKPVDRMPKLVAYLGGKTTRAASLPLVVGEYNGYSGKSISDMGDWLLASPRVLAGCCWNSTGGKGAVLTGDRLTAFQETLVKAHK